MSKRCDEILALIDAALDTDDTDEPPAAAGDEPEGDIDAEDH